MIDSLTKYEKQFLKNWLASNLLGWIMGGFSGLCIGQFYLAPIIGITFNTKRIYALDPLFIWIPLGAWIGIMQWVKMKKREIQPVVWVVATVIGWSFPATVLSWCHENQLVRLFGYSNFPVEILFDISSLIIVGASVGAAQAALMGKILSTRKRWVWANVLGFLACGITLVIVVFIASYVLPLESSIGGRTFDFLIWVVILITLPLIGILLAIPTGIVLIRFGNPPPNYEKGLES